MPNYSPRRMISFQTSSGKKKTEIAISNELTLSPLKNEQTQSSVRKKPFQSPFRDDPFNETKDDETFMRKVMTSPTSSLRGHINYDSDRASHMSASSSRKANHSLSGSKRRNIDTIPPDGDHDDTDIIARTEESLKLNRSGSCDVDSPLEESNQPSNCRETIEDIGNRAVMPWTDVS